MNIEEAKIYRGIDEISGIIKTPLFTYKVFICGGYARYCLNPEPDLIDQPTDIDIYCTDWSSYYGLVERFNQIYGSTLYSSNENNSDVVFYSYNPNKFQPYLERYPILRKLPVQIMSPKFGSSIEEIFDNFDFTVCQAAITGRYDFRHKYYNVGVVSDEFLGDLKSKKLVINKMNSNDNTLARVLSYIYKGYNVQGFFGAMQVLGLISNYNLRDYRRLFSYLGRKGILKGSFGEDLVNIYLSTIAGGNDE